MNPFVARLREQIELLYNEEYNYDELHIYVSGIGEPWVFGRYEAIEFDGEEVLVVREREEDNEGVPEHVFPIRHIVATQLVVTEE
jgi:hypothetical protein